MTVSQELRTGVRCVVTHPSKNGEFQKGDVIWLEEDGAIMNGTIKAWMAAEDVLEATEGMEVKSANPVAQELREWAMYSSRCRYGSISLPACIQFLEMLDDYWQAHDAKPLHRRTFALLVACALEDE